MEEGSAMQRIRAQSLMATWPIKAHAQVKHMIWRSASPHVWQVLCSWYWCHCFPLPPTPTEENCKL